MITPRCGFERKLAQSPRSVAPGGIGAHEESIMRIGSRQVRTVLAPMEGVSHPAFRQLMATRGGLDLVCTEFVRISPAPLSPRVLAGSVVTASGPDGDLPLSVQVMGNDAIKMAEAAAHVSAAGAAVVDVNMGCPMPRVVRKGVGAAMLKDPALLVDVLGRMREAVPGLLSAKIRAGFDDAQHVLHIASLVQESGADFIAVHPRRRCDFYEGVADWRIIGALSSELRIPVIGNGDVWYASDALRMERETGCDAVMIGRPAMRNPWIFEQIADLRAGRSPRSPRGEDLFAWLVHVREVYAATFDDRSARGRRRRHGWLGKLKELVRWFGRAVHDDGAFRNEALRAQSVDALMEIAERHLALLPPERLDLQSDGPWRLERSGSGLSRAQGEPLLASWARSA